jgi:hypothetical protein
MTVLVIIDTVLLCLAVVYIVALLRSHADILRRLSLLEENGPPAAVTETAGTPRPAALEGERATEIAGVTLDGAPASIDAGGGILLAFLTSGCASCRPFWEDLGNPDAVAALGARVAIVAHDADSESITRLRELAPAGVELIMASSAWRDYAIPSSPHFVLLDGAGGIAGRGAAIGWQQLVSIVGDARADAGDAAGPRARTTSERAARAERALAQAGITPGHPSLYPGDE